MSFLRTPDGSRRPSTISARSLVRATLFAIGTLLSILKVPAWAAAPNSPQIPISNANWGGTDDLGRSLPSFADVGAPKPNRWVGLFFWHWHGSLTATEEMFDLSLFLAKHPYFTKFDPHPRVGPPHTSIYWGEPIWGYYRSDDPWVIRKQLCLIADAGVDFVYLDYTNSSVYDRELGTFLEILRDLKSKGVAVPRVTFFLNHQPQWKVEHLYKNWYQPGKYDDLWFRWQGKPLMLSPALADSDIPAMREYFTFRPTWALHKAEKEPTKWRFMAENPSPVALGPDGQPEQVAVNKSMGGPLNQNFFKGGVSATGDRRFTRKDYLPDWTMTNVAQGVFFQESWDRAMATAPPMVLVTGWNEWTAGIWERPGVPMFGVPTRKGEGHIVDEFNRQFNRDIEPERGGTFDAYYWQFVANMRRYKGMLPPAAVYRDSVGDTANRDWASKVPWIKPYVNKTARNDLARASVAADAASLTFTIDTAAPLTPASDPNWMWLLIDSDNNPKTGWNGYDLVVNRTREGSKVSVERQAGAGWAWQAVSTSATCTIAGNRLSIRIPRSTLGLAADAAPRFNFKWADNLPATPTIGDFYTEGDVAPNARFNYHFGD